MKQVVFTTNAPAPIGPYSQAIRAEGKFVFISGQIPLTATGELAGEDIRTQTQQCIKNIASILESVGLSLENIVKTTVLMKNLDHFSEMNQVYNSFFETSKPARATFQVVKLPMDVLVEIEAVAVF
jgi:2-iminobutanoate/2-iminopropanoate deaminase